MKYIFTLSLLLLNLSSFAQNRILTDGEFNDWTNFNIAHTDPGGDNGNSGIDLGNLQIHNDEEFVFFSIETGSEINLQDDNELAIYIDTDENPNTGLAANGIGAELVYYFGDRVGFLYLTGNPLTIYHEDIHLVCAPTVSATRFEIAIKRTLSIFGIPMFPNNTIRVAFRDNGSNGDVLPDVNGGIDYEFIITPPPSLPEYSIAKKQASDLRVLSYNVLSDGLFDNSKVLPFSRILEAIQPDIIGFQEIYDHNSQEVANQVTAMLPGINWYHADAGPDIHAISKYPILESYELAGVESSQGNGAFLIDLPNLTAHLLFIVAHTPCCGNDAGRQVEVDAIMAFLRDAKAGTGSLQLEENSPIIITGDMNFVGGSQQLQTLLTGDIINTFPYGADFAPDWDGSDLLDSRPYTTGLPMAFTWYREASSFAPGRLDFAIYTGSNLTLQNNYALFTRNLPADSLSTYNLLSSDVTTASDHLPIVSDFQLNSLTDISNPSLSVQPVLEIQPNPAGNLTQVNLQMPHSTTATLRLYDVLGNEVKRIFTKPLSAGKHLISLDLAILPAGVYVLHLDAGLGGILSRRLVVER